MAGLVGRVLIIGGALLGLAAILVGDQSVALDLAGGGVLAIAAGILVSAA